ncbi:MAG: DUF1064 domain-containing protein [Dongiaceae bacterium]
MGKSKTMSESQWIKHRNKYHNRVTTVDGRRFQSYREAKRYAELLLMEKTKIVSDLRLQVPFEVRVNDVHICTYRADFVYKQLGEFVVEDVKGFRTEVYKLKKKLVEATHGVTILEV